jgi:hypothetical protein
VEMKVVSLLSWAVFNSQLPPIPFRWCVCSIFRTLKRWNLAVFVGNVIGFVGNIIDMYSLNRRQICHYVIWDRIRSSRR